MKKQTWALLMFSSHQKHKQMPVETEVSDIPKNETAPEAEPSVEREGPFYFLFTRQGWRKIRSRKQTLWSG
ncbi:Exonuclease RNase T and DNA polymerase III [Escherichia coli]|uniref:Exonuclease RNase T and DNA polymerase III n=1 Tax=Escherichia coli TaxID=562 RepID=A0A376S707_ECOLX|nr:Exonuclease RNase T and DNA polymerase III [Escherichia coli]